MVCKNCNQSIEGEFCHHCGQNAQVQRINFKYISSEFSSSILQINNGLLYTVKELFTRPGHSIREFLEGKRVRHFKPLAFVLVTSTIYVIASYLTEVKTVLADFISGMAGASESNDQTTAIFHDTLIWFENHYAYSTLFTLIFFSFASYLVFKKDGYNYFEHIVLNLYITGQQTIIFLLLHFFYLILNPENYVMQFITLLGSVFYCFWVYIQFFQNRGVIGNILRVASIYILTAIFILALLFIFGMLTIAGLNAM
ncbi:DUF3667 domain-containing protein [bacterium SCSIO 12643]|nr:DUF3667 domain-containing protein [bacterium SCSIO 12643]